MLKRQVSSDPAGINRLPRISGANFDRSCDQPWACALDFFTECAGKPRGSIRVKAEIGQRVWAARDKGWTFNTENLIANMRYHGN